MHVSAMEWSSGPNGPELKKWHPKTNDSAKSGSSENLWWLSESATVGISTSHNHEFHKSRADTRYLRY